MRDLTTRASPCLPIPTVLNCRFPLNMHEGAWVIGAGTQEHAPFQAVLAVTRTPLPPRLRRDTCLM